MQIFICFISLSLAIKHGRFCMSDDYWLGKKSIFNWLWILWLLNCVGFPCWDNKPFCHATCFPVSSLCYFLSIKSSVVVCVFPLSTSVSVWVDNIQGHSSWHSLSALDTIEMKSHSISVFIPPSDTQTRKCNFYQICTCKTEQVLRSGGRTCGPPASRLHSSVLITGCTMRLRGRKSLFVWIFFYRCYCFFFFLPDKTISLSVWFFSFQGSFGWIHYTPLKLWILISFLFRGMTNVCNAIFITATLKKKKNNNAGLWLDVFLFLHS